MPNFRPIVGQRYLSESEPELGLGMISDLEDKTFKIFFPAISEERTYSIFNPPLRRVVFEVGDEIIIDTGEKLNVLEVLDEEGIKLYKTSNEVIPETRLNENISFSKPQDKIYNGFSDSSSLYHLRIETLEHYINWSNSQYKGLIGGRINFLPHQMYVADKVCNSNNKKFFLSDEVGLGKTIEAGLIIHKLLLTNSVSKVAIIVPDALVNQWFIELFRKFNLTFNVFNKETELFESGNPFTNSNFNIISMNLLRGAKQARDWLLEFNPDMLVCDEAHQIKISEENEFEFYSKLSENSYVSLFLTATPEHKGSEDHFNRLKLLNPSEYSDFKEFQARVSRSKEIGELIKDLKKNKADLARYFKSDVNLEELSDKQIISLLLELGGTGKSVIRNSRKSIEKSKVFFPDRILHPYHLEDQKNAKLDWLISFIDNNRKNKVLLICKTKDQIIEIEKYIARNSTNHKVGLFHSDLTLIARDRQAAFFHESDGANILLCTEIGSEGRNFEFCHELVLFDLPMRPDVIEQRIGRLDRIGQRNHINIHVPILKSSPEELIFDWLHEGLNIFESYKNYSNLVYEKFAEDIDNIIENHDRKKLDAIIPKIKLEINKLEEEFLKDRDFLVEKNSFDHEKSDEIVRSLKSIDSNDILESFLEKVFDEFGVDQEELEYKVWYIIPNSNMYIPYFPELSNEGLSYTTDRSMALEREDLHFMTWEHPLVQGVFNLILSEGYGNANAASRRKPGKSYIECHFKFFVKNLKKIDIHSLVKPVIFRSLIDSAKLDLTKKWDTSFLTEQSIEIHPEKLLKLGQNKNSVNNLITICHENTQKVFKEYLKNKSIEIDKKYNAELQRLSLLQENEEIEVLISNLQKEVQLIRAHMKNSDLELDMIRLIV
jgi:ATP-dependent helicase HepA